MNQPLDYEQLTWIGTILGAHGLKGEVRVRPLTDTPEYYLGVEEFMLETREALRPLKVEKIRPHSDGWRIRFDEFKTRIEADPLKGFRLLLPDKKLRPLERNEVFLHRLAGCRVLDREGEDYGEVTGTLETGANLVFEVRLRNQEYMIPDSPGIVLDLDVDARKLIIDPVPGLIDLPTDIDN